jgi:hypothetical protein
MQIHELRKGSGPVARPCLWAMFVEWGREKGSGGQGPTWPWFLLALHQVSGGVSAPWRRRLVGRPPWGRALGSQAPAPRGRARAAPARGTPALNPAPSVRTYAWRAHRHHRRPWLHAPLSRVYLVRKGSGYTTRAASGSFFQAPVINGWVFPTQLFCKSSVSSSNHREQTGTNPSQRIKSMPSLRFKGSAPMSLLKSATFFVFGFGPSWLVPSLLFLEVPAFQRELPEHLCLSTFLNLSVHASTLFVLLYHLVHSHCSCSPRLLDSIFVGTSLFLALFGMILVATSWHVVVGNRSVVLLCAAVIGGAVGSISSVALMPFLSRYDSSAVPMVRTGGSVITLFAAAVVSVQQPGSPDAIAFSPSACLGLPIGAWFMLSNAAEEGEGCCPGGRETAGLICDSETAVDGEDVSTPAAVDGSADSYQVDAQKEAKQRLEAGADGADGGAIQEARATEHAEWWARFELMLMVGWVDFNCWGIQSALFPFAAKHTGRAHDGSTVLGYILQVPSPAHSRAPSLAHIRIRYPPLRRTVLCVYVCAGVCRLVRLACA